MNLQYACSTRVRNGGVQQAAGNAAAPMCRVNKHAPQHGLVRDLRKRFTPQAGNTDQLRPGKSTQHDLMIGCADAVTRFIKRARSLFIVRRPDGGGRVLNGPQAQRLERCNILIDQRADGDNAHSCFTSTVNASPVSKNAPPAR